VRLKRLVAEGFRNLVSTDLDLDARFVVLFGPNAQGKTNALEAVHWIATLKPLRSRKVRELVAWDSERASVSGWVESAGIVCQHRVDLGSEGRVARLDGKRVGDLESYFAGIRAIAFVPQDGGIVSGEPSRRRNWLDRAAFTAGPAHLARVRVVKQILAQKAAALRGDRVDMALLDVLDEQLAVRGAELAARRIAMLEELAPHASRMHAEIAGGTSDVRLEYATRAATVEALRERLGQVRSREVERRTTLAGPQLDDVRVVLDGRPARDFGSRGQIRSLVLSLKLAEMVAARERGEVPMFLVDDVSSELDRARTERLIGLLTELDAQVLLTTTDPGLLRTALAPAQTLMLPVRAGVVGPANG
jgi:DNA replication and repair protein RecF